MSEIPINPATGRREMTREQVIERERLNVANTSEAIRQRTLARAATRNGRGVQVERCYYNPGTPCNGTCGCPSCPVALREAAGD